MSWRQTCYECQLCRWFKSCTCEKSRSILCLLPKNQVNMRYPQEYRRTCTVKWVFIKTTLRDHWWRHLYNIYNLQPVLRQLYWRPDLFVLTCKTGLTSPKNYTAEHNEENGLPVINSRCSAMISFLKIFYFLSEETPEAMVFYCSSTPVAAVRADDLQNFLNRLCFFTESSLRQQWEETSQQRRSKPAARGRSR